MTDDFTPNRAICIMVCGKKYEKQYRALLPTLSRYAAKVNAKIEVVKSLPDPTMYRNVLCQKLLLPSLFLNYDEVVFLDCDIAINDNAANIFNFFPTDKGLAAVLDERDTEYFKNAWAQQPEVLALNTQRYFESRGFTYNSNLLGSINGGVLLFRPKMVAKMYADFYYSSHPYIEHEESAFAYLAQTNQLFHPLPKSFNSQVLYSIRNLYTEKEIRRWTSWIPKFLLKRYKKWRDIEVYPSLSYKKFIRKIGKEVDILHFAGKYPIVRK